MKRITMFLARLAMGPMFIVAIAPQANAVDWEVEIEDFAFVPHGTHINVGDTVTWRNRDDIQHTSTSDTGIWNSGLLSRDQRFSFVFTIVGTYPYHCTPHPTMRDTIFVAPQTGIDEGDANTPFKFELAQNYPNPFNARTVIGYSLPLAAHVRVEIFNLIGQSVETVLDENQNAGNHQVAWDAIGRNSGVYFYRVTANGQSRTGRMALLK